MAIKDAWIVITRGFNLNFAVAVSALMIAVSGTANAAFITLDPDDYGIGVPLENEFVTTAWVDGPLKNHAWNSALLARDGREYDPDYIAPTGNLIFGAFPFVFIEGDPAASFGGLGIKFHQDVSRITLLANSIYPPGDLSAVWMAFDIDGKQIATGYAGGDRPASETFKIEIEGKGVRSLILGGDYATSAICFDHLTFELDTASLSEPGSMVLFMMGLMVFALRLKSVSAQHYKNRLPD